MSRRKPAKTEKHGAKERRTKGSASKATCVPGPFQRFLSFHLVRIRGPSSEFALCKNAYPEDGKRPPGKIRKREKNNWVYSAEQKGGLVQFFHAVMTDLLKIEFKTKTNRTP